MIRIQSGIPETPDIGMTWGMLYNGVRRRAQVSFFLCFPLRAIFFFRGIFNVYE